MYLLSFSCNVRKNYVHLRYTFLFESSFILYNLLLEVNLHTFKINVKSRAFVVRKGILVFAKSGEIIIYLTPLHENR